MASKTHLNRYVAVCAGAACLTIAGWLWAQTPAATPAPPKLNESPDPILRPFEFRSIGPAAGAFTRDRFSFRCDHDPAQLAALRAGVGIGGCQTKIAARTPQLIRLLAQDIDFRLEMWLAMHEDLKTTRRVRLLFEFLRVELRDYAST